MEQRATQGVLRRSNDAFLGGVCAGIAERIDADAIVVRILFVLVAGTTFGLGVVAYLLLWALLPSRPEPHGPYDVEAEQVGSLWRDGCETSARCFRGSPGHRRLPIAFRLAIAVGLMILFLVVSANVSSIVSGTQWWQFWPLAFLIAGLCLIVIPVYGRFEAAWHAVGIAVTSIAAFVLPMSLGVMSWETVPRAFDSAWPLVLAALFSCAVGGTKRSDALIVISALCIAAFCLVGMLACSVTGSMEALVLNMPDGTLMSIAVMR